MFAAKQIYLGRCAKAAPTAKSYVQDGLIAMWDGIENASWGGHSTDVVRDGWVDLINGLTLHINPVNNPETTTSGIFTDSKSVIFRKRAMRVNAIDDSKVLDVLNSVRSGFYTEQVVGRRYELGNSCALVAVQTVNTGDTARRAIHYYDTYNNANEFNSQNHYDKYLGVGNWPSGFDGSPCSFSWMRTLSGVKLYRNGVLWKNASGTCQEAPVTNAGAIMIQTAFYNANAITGLTTATAENDLPVHCVRFYDHELTAAEIAANYAVDKERFNLP